MDKTEQLLREMIQETILLEKKRRKKKGGRSFKPQNITDLLATRIKDPLEWRNDIYNAMSKADGRVGDAADDLKVSKRTLQRALSEPALDDVPRAPMGRPVEDDK